MGWVHADLIPVCVFSSCVPFYNKCVFDFVSTISFFKSISHLNPLLISFQPKNQSNPVHDSRILFEVYAGFAAAAPFVPPSSHVSKL